MEKIMFILPSGLPSQHSGFNEQIWSGVGEAVGKPGIEGMDPILRKGEDGNTRF